jgi:hypothetical protein
MAEGTIRSSGAVEVVLFLDFGRSLTAEWRR